MKEDFMIPFQKEMETKRDELCAYISANVRKISFPIQPVINVSETNSNSPKYKYFIGCGFAGLVIGALASGAFSKTLMIVGGIALVGGIYQRSQQSKQTVPEEPAVDYSLLTNRIYKQLEQIHSFVFKEWDKFLGMQKNALKDLLQTMDVTNECRNEMFDLAVKRSVINMSMTEVLSALNKLERQQDVEAYKRYVNNFEQTYKAVIEKAFADQQATYKQISDIYMEK